MTMEQKFSMLLRLAKLAFPFGPYRVEFVITDGEADASVRIFHSANSTCGPFPSLDAAIDTCTNVVRGDSIRDRAKAESLANQAKRAEEKLVAILKERA
jgi:hypothetical protein